MDLISHDQFIEKYKGKYVERGGSANAKNQCVDLANAYLEEVIGVEKILWTNARDFDDKLSNDSRFKIHINTPDFVPLKGMIAIWEHDSSGHISIVNTANKNTFTSFDQNWPEYTPAHLQAHGYLRPPVAKFIEYIGDADDDIIGDVEVMPKYISAWFNQYPDLKMDEGTIIGLLNGGRESNTLRVDLGNERAENEKLRITVREIREDLIVCESKLKEIPVIDEGNGEGGANMGDVNNDKKWWTSKTIWLAVANAILTVAVAIQTQYPEYAWIGLIVSGLMVFIRFLTDTPLTRSIK